MNAALAAEKRACVCLCVRGENNGALVNWSGRGGVGGHTKHNSDDSQPGWPRRMRTCFSLRLDIFLRCVSELQKEMRCMWDEEISSQRIPQFYCRKLNGDDESLVYFYFTLLDSFSKELLCLSALRLCQLFVLLSTLLGQIKWFIGGPIMVLFKQRPTNILKPTKQLDLTEEKQYFAQLKRNCHPNDRFI